MAGEPPSSASAQAPASGPGEALRAAREARGASVQDVADVLNLTVKVVEDLEAEAWERLPGAAFTKGYLRAYAKLVDLDGIDLVGAYGDGVGDPRAATLDSGFRGAESPRITEVIHKQPGAVISGSVAAVIVVVAFVIWLVWPAEAPENGEILVRQPPAPTTRPSATVAPTLPVDAIQTDPGEEATITAMPKEAVEQPIEAAGVADETIESSEVLVREAPVSPVESVDVVEAEPVVNAPLAEGGEDRLSMLFSEDCWVEVRDAAGRNIHSDLGRPGALLELTGKAPFRVLLGYAPAVELSFNDEPVALAPHTRNNVASLVLGQ